MGARGPKSVADRSSAVWGPVVPGQPPPPEELEAVEQDTWREITARLPSDWFTAEQRPMLRELCRHVHYADELARDMAAVRAEIDAVAEGFDLIALESDVVEGRRKAQAKLQGELLALLRAHGYQSERIGNLSTKLRLTNQSRWSGRKADQQSRKLSAGPKPWQDWG